METTRRAFVAGASALPLLSPSRPARAADPADFEAALRAKFARGDVLNWTGGNVVLGRPIVIDVTESLTTAGVDLNGGRILCDFNDSGRSALTIRIPPERKGVAFRGLKVFNGSFQAVSPALDAIDLVCLTNRSWIYSWKFMNLDIEGFARDGLLFDGSVFEGDCHAVTCSSNGRNGMTFRSNGSRDDIGIVSAVAIFGGQMRLNGNAGMETQSAFADRIPRDLNISQTYFVENKGPGLHATAGFSMAIGCGFENNGECGIRMTNEGRMFACRGGTYGPQPYLVNAVLRGGGMLLDACRIEGYSGFEGKMRFVKASGVGEVVLRDCGRKPAVDAIGAISVQVK